MSACLNEAVKCTVGDPCEITRQVFAKMKKVTRLIAAFLDAFLLGFQVVM